VQEESTAATRSLQRGGRRAIKWKRSDRNRRGEEGATVVKLKRSEREPPR
jgi:hypothetical protein